MEEAVFDHAMLLTGSLEDGRHALTRLGFRPTPIGRHTRLGTENCTVVLPDGSTYFELLAVTQPTPKNADKRAALAAAGPHIHGLAIKGDAHALNEHFATQALSNGEPVAFARPVDGLPDGTQEARFTIASMAPDALPGLYGFVCQHHTPDLVWRKDYLAQPNGAFALTGLWGVAADPGALATDWSRIFGGSVRLADVAMTATLGQTRVTYLTPDAFRATFGTAPPSGETPRLVALAFAVADHRHLASVLTENGVAFEHRGGWIRVPDTLGLGAIFLFAEETRPTA